MSGITIILLGHEAQVGKDTLANLLVERQGFVKYAYADKIKMLGKEIFGLTDEQLRGTEKEVPIERLGGKTSRMVQQKIGCDFRDVWENCWVNYVAQRIIYHLHCGEAFKFVISDFRFPNEYYYLKEIFSDEMYQPAKIKAIKIIRSGANEISNKDHISEHALADFKDWSVCFINERTIESLYEDCIDFFSLENIEIS
jgi:hypothetical protein